MRKIASPTAALSTARKKSARNPARRQLEDSKRRFESWRQNGDTDACKNLQTPVEKGQQNVATVSML